MVKCGKGIPNIGWPYWYLVRGRVGIIVHCCCSSLGSRLDRNSKDFLSHYIRLFGFLSLKILFLHILQCDYIIISKDARVIIEYIII